MKITGFNPQIATNDPESVIALFEELGFERTHTKTGIKEGAFTAFRMKDANGFHLDVLQTSFPKTFQMIRINVDDFAEAFEFFMSRGFRRARGFDNDVETPSSIFAIIVSPEGTIYDLCQHIKK